MAGRSLLERVQGLLERTYGMRTGVLDVGRFVIGDVGFRSIYGGATLVAKSSRPEAGGARTLVRESDEGVRACIYLPDALVRCLEEHPPQAGVGDANVDAFAALVEELDHLLCIAERTAEGRPLSFFELELHANVSKYLVLARYISGDGRPLGPRNRLWIRYHLFEKGRFCEEDPSVNLRYRDATRWAVHLLRGVEGMSLAERIAILRRFHAAPASGKLELIGRLAA